MQNSFPFSLHAVRNALKLWIFHLLCATKKGTPAEPWPAHWPLISVVIPCYNHGHFLPEAVESVLAQTIPDIEIIVVNDGSTDKETISVLETFSHPKTTILNHEKNLGLPAARNTGIRRAKGKYICCLDADDKLHPTYLEKSVMLMESDTGIGFTYPWTQVFGVENRVWYTPQFDPAVLINHNQLNALGVFRRLAWEQVGGFREEMRLGMEDWEFWIRLARHGFRGYRIPEKLIFVRRLGRSFVHAAMDLRDQLMADIRRYNPDVYEDLSWLEEVKRDPAERFVRTPFANLGGIEIFPAHDKPLLYINYDSAVLLKNKLSAILERIRTYQGNTIFISLEWLDEEVTDTLFAHTPYVYILSNFLPPCVWKQFLDLKRTRIQKAWSRASEQLSYRDRE